ncbi:MAG: hypothetical protein Q9225_005751 [Loekoesia sp. 1 TL-2023]
MHIPCAFFIVGLVVARLTHASSACGSLPTVTVTVTASQATETVINAANPLTPVPSDVTTTLSSTNFLTNTKVVTVADVPVSAPSQLNAFQDGNYYFPEDNGTTTWLSDKTPTSGAVLVTNTLIVTVQPQPVTETSTIVAASSSEDTTTTSIVTISSTSFYTHYLTKALSLQSASTSVPSARLSPYLGSYGWNATLSAVQRLKSQAIAPQSSDAYVANDAVWPSPSPVPTAASYVTKRYHPRQIGAVVTATIDGVVVSWTNSYGGETTSSHSATSIETSSAKTAATHIPPIFNPYRKLFFNGGYGYVPPPSDPYAPVSPPQLAVYNYHNDSVSQQSIDAGLELHGEIGAGPRVNESAYWINAYSTWIGCANAGPSECRIDFIGYDKFDAEIATQTLLQPPCPGLVNCKLAQVTFTSQFRDLAGLQILAFVNKTPVTFYMDDLSLGWSNNTCAAQLERSSGE